MYQASGPPCGRRADNSPKPIVAIANAAVNAKPRNNLVAEIADCDDVVALMYCERLDSNHQANSPIRQITTSTKMVRPPDLPNTESVRNKLTDDTPKPIPLARASLTATSDHRCRWRGQNAATNAKPITKATASPPAVLKIIGLCP